MSTRGLQSAEKVSTMHINHDSFTHLSIYQKSTKDSLRHSPSHQGAWQSSESSQVYKITIQEYTENARENGYMQ